MSSNSSRSTTRKPRAMPGSSASSPEPPERAVTLETAARVAGVTPQVIVGWMRREGRSLFVRVGDLEALLADPDARERGRRRTRTRREDPRQLSFLDRRRGDV